MMGGRCYECKYAYIGGKYSADMFADYICKCYPPVYIAGTKHGIQPTVKGADSCGEFKEKMGVLACNRAGCENIMCGRYSELYGYICNSCFDEMVGRDVTLTSSIHSFMHTKKRECTDPIHFYSDIFPIT